MNAATGCDVKIRGLRMGDLSEVKRIDALHTQEQKPEYWQRVFSQFVGEGADPERVALGVEAEQGLLGYLFGEVRAFEFGSAASGWIFSVGVDPECTRSGVATALLDEAKRRFAAVGVTRLRTMVRRNDVPVLSFFRANKFVGGAFAQLELDLEEPS